MVLERDRLSPRRGDGGVGNGPDALILARRALDFEPGDEAIVPPNTFIATWAGRSSRMPRRRTVYRTAGAALARTAMQGWSF